MMNPTMLQVMAEIRNAFPVDLRQGTITLTGGRVSPEGVLLPGDYVLFEGSRSNRQVYLVDAEGRLPDTTDETFEGILWVLDPPDGFLKLVEHIDAWCQGQPQEDGILSESWNGYSRTRLTDAAGDPPTWQKRFARELSPYRRMFSEVKLT